MAARWISQGSCWYDLAVGESGNSLTAPLHPYSNTYSRERGVQQNDRSLADGAGSSCAAGTADTDYNPATPCVGCEDEWIDVPTCASAGCSCSR